jgi:hypothetical protein
MGPFSCGPRKRGRSFYFGRRYSTLLLTSALGKGTNDRVYCIASFNTLDIALLKPRLLKVNLLANIKLSCNCQVLHMFVSRFRDHYLPSIINEIVHQEVIAYRVRTKGRRRAEVECSSRQMQFLLRIYLEGN